MDTSKKYIRMCLEAKEIQYGWNRALGDVYYRYKEKPPMVYVCAYPTPIADSIWLPRQDQLQEIAFTLPSLHGRVMKPLFELFDWFYDFVWDKTKGTELTSFEQLWLAFVMREKYGKKWNGKDWKE